VTKLEHGVPITSINRLELTDIHYEICEFCFFRNLQRSDSHLLNIFSRDLPAHRDQHGLVLFENGKTTLMNRLLSSVWSEYVVRQ